MKKKGSAISRVILQSAYRVAKTTHASTLFISMDPLKELPDDLPKGCRLAFVTQKTPGEIEASHSGTFSGPLIHLPKIHMTRMGQIKTAMVLALSKKLVTLGDKIVFATGSTDVDLLDSVVYIDTAREAEVLTIQGMENLSEEVLPEVFQQILSIALELANRGREGKPVGTIFVLGDEEKVLQLSRQMIINPFKGYTDDEKNILNSTLRDTLFEFAALDGAFVISHDGLVLAAGRHLGTAADEDTIPRGLGSRHIAAAGITALTQAIAIVISESTGDLRIFKNGKILMEIEKPSRVPPQTK